MKAIKPLLALRLRKLVSDRWMSLLLVAMAVFLSACGSAGVRDDQNGSTLPAEFTIPVAAAQEAGLTVYWLGEQFEVDGLTFSVTGASFETPEEAPLLQIFCQADFEGGGTIGLTLAISPVGGYDEGIDRVLSRPGDVSQESTTVRGWRAEVFGIPVGRWVNRLVIVEAPGAVILARANATIGNFRQVNPLNDPNRLLAVMESLRPYPE
jgi:hypothetical protein